MKAFVRVLKLLPIFAIAFICTYALFGHKFSSTPTPSANPINTGGVDLTQTYVAASTTGDGDNNEPLTVAESLASSAGGTWVVFSPNPLDDVSGVSDASSQMSVSDTMNAMQNAGTPIAWDSWNGYMLLDFASSNDLATLKAQPPAHTVGVFIRANTDDALLKAFADIEHISLTVDPAILTRRAAFRASHTQSDSDSGSSNGPQFEALAKLDRNALMQYLAEFYGSRFVNSNGNQWSMEPISDSLKIKSDVDWFQQSLSDSMSQQEPTGAFTSYEERKDGTAKTASDDTDDTLDTPLPNDVLNQFDALGMLGSSAVPTLAGFLDIKEPRYAMAAIQTLGAMDVPDARQALVSFKERLGRETVTDSNSAAHEAVGSLLSDVLKKASSSS